MLDPWLVHTRSSSGLETLISVHLKCRWMIEFEVQIVRWHTKFSQMDIGQYRLIEEFFDNIKEKCVTEVISIICRSIGFHRIRKRNGPTSYARISMRHASVWKAAARKIRVKLQTFPLLPGSNGSMQENLNVSGVRRLVNVVLPVLNNHGALLSRVALVIGFSIAAHPSVCMVPIRIFPTSVLTRSIQFRE